MVLNFWPRLELCAAKTELKAFQKAEGLKVKLPWKDGALDVVLDKVVREDFVKEFYSKMKLLTEDELNVMLFYKDDDDTIRSMINGREFHLIDMEHMC